MAAIGAALLLLLKILGIVLLVLLCLLLILLFVPASVWVDYSHEVLSVKAGMLFLKLRLLPQKEKKPKTEKQLAAEEKKAAKKAAKKAKKDAAKAAKKKKTKKVPDNADEKMKLTLEQICIAVKGAGRFMKAVIGALRITHIRIHLPVTGSDAADTAILYGKTQAWLHGCLGILNHAIWLDFDECRIEPDYTGKQGDVTHCSCKISAQLIIIVIAGAKLFFLLKDNDILDAFL